jgi:hypothetical protein
MNVDHQERSKSSDVFKKRITDLRNACRKLLYKRGCQEKKCGGSPVKVKLVIFSLHIFPADLLMPIYFIKYIECNEQPPTYQVYLSRTHDYFG